MTHLLALLVALRVAVLAAGALLTLLTLLRYRRSRALDHLLLFGGFGLIALGALIEGVLFEFFSVPLATAHTVESVVSALGLLSVLLAILVSRR